MKQDKPFYQQAVFWQAVVAALLFPLATLPGRLSIDMAPDVAVGLVIVYFAGVTVSVFWSMSRMLSDIVLKRVRPMTSLVPMLLSGSAAYILYAAANGWWPFPPNIVP